MTWPLTPHLGQRPRGKERGPRSAHPHQEARPQASARRQSGLKDALRSQGQGPHSLSPSHVFVYKNATFSNIPILTGKTAL